MQSPCSCGHFEMRLTYVALSVTKLWAFEEKKYFTRQNLNLKATATQAAVAAVKISSDILFCREESAKRAEGKWTAGPPDDTPARSVWVGSCASWKVGFSPWLPPLILSPPPPPSPILSNFKCQCRPPRLVWSASPSGYDLSRYPPVTWWGEHFFLQSVLWETP